MTLKTGLATALVAAVVAALVTAVTLVVVWRTAPGVVDAPSASLDEKKIVAVVRDYLTKNPEILVEMTNELDKAEQHLRKATTMRGATSQIRQNLALVIGLQGRFEEAQSMFARELPPEQVESNMSYIRALLTQQNRWDLIKGAN